MSESTSLPAPSAHCPYGPSALARLDKCPGAARLCELVVSDRGGEAAERGTRIHALAAALISGQAVPEDADADELKYATMIHDFANTIIEPGDKVSVEKRLAYRDIGGEIYFGTSDLVVEKPGHVVFVCDWKTGFGEVPEAPDNLQGAAYALAAMQEMGKSGAEVYFYNPCTNWRSAAFFDSADGLAREVLGVIDRAKAPDAPLCPSEEACRWCAACAICPAHLAVAEASMNLTDGTERCRDITEWSDAAVALWYGRLGMAARFLEQMLKPELLRRIREKGECSGLRVRQQSGGREARDIRALANAVCSLLTQDEFLDCCSVSIAQLKAKYAEAAKENGEADTKKAGEALFEEATAGMLLDREPRRVIYMAKKEKAVNE